MRRIEYRIECDGAINGACLASGSQTIILHPTSAEVQTGLVKDQARKAMRRRGWLHQVAPGIGANAPEPRDYCPPCGAALKAHAMEMARASRAEGDARRAEAERAGRCPA